MGTGGLPFQAGIVPALIFLKEKGAETPAQCDGKERDLLLCLQQFGKVHGNQSKLFKMLFPLPTLLSPLIVSDRAFICPSSTCFSQAECSKGHLEPGL